MKFSRFAVGYTPLWAFNFVFAALQALMNNADDGPAQFDPTQKLWQLWVYCLLFFIAIALPLLTMEFALAQRSRTLPFPAYTEIAREDGISTKWPLLAWSGPLITTIMAWTLLLTVSGYNTEYIIRYIHWDDTLLLLAVATLTACIIAIVLSLIPRAILLTTATVFSFATLAMGLTDNVLSSMPVGNTMLPAAIFAFVLSGFGIGLYWPFWMGTKQTAARAVMPVLIAQTAAMTASIWMGGINLASPAHMACFSLSTLTVSAILFQSVLRQWQTRFSAKAAVAITILPVLLLSYSTNYLSKIALSDWEFWIFWLVVMPIIFATIAISLLHMALFGIFTGTKADAEKLYRAAQLPSGLWGTIWWNTARILILLFASCSALLLLLLFCYIIPGMIIFS